MEKGSSVCILSQDLACTEVNGFQRIFTVKTIRYLLLRPIGTKQLERIYGIHEVVQEECFGGRTPSHFTSICILHSETSGPGGHTMVRG